jgi:hypothetical protein
VATAVVPANHFHWFDALGTPNQLVEAEMPIA